MQLIDLTHEICPSMPAFPGTMPPLFYPANTIEEDGFRERRIEMFSHTGTHMDAPSHIFKGGKCLDDFEISKFFGSSTIVDLTAMGGERIEVEHLTENKELIKDSDFLILHTGWYKRWDDETYFSDFPSLTPGAAEWLSDMNLKGIGIDAISIDDIKSEELEIHKILLKEDIVIIENLNSLDQIKWNKFLFSCMPLKFKDADGSPVRAFAIKK